MKRDDYSASGTCRVSVLLSFSKEVELNIRFFLHMFPF